MKKMASVELGFREDGLEEKVMKVRVSSAKDWEIGLVVGITIIVRYLLTLLPSYQVDMGGYSAWSLYLAKVGFDGFYETFHVVYAPAYMYLLWVTGKITTLFSLNLETHVVLIKLWAVLSDLVGGYPHLSDGKRLGKAKLGFILGTVYALNPAVFFNSSVWGQFDSIPATILLGVLYCFTLQRSVTAVILFTLSVLTKPQSAMVLPIVLYLFFRTCFLEKTAFRNDWGASNLYGGNPSVRRGTAFLLDN